MEEKKALVQCVECGNPMPAVQDAKGIYYIMGASNCPRCEGDEFEEVGL